MLERFQRVGMFLVRASSIDKDSYALSYLHSTGASGYVMHVLISYNHKTKMYQLDEQDCAPTVSQVIACCSQPDQAWLPSPLVMSCPQLGTLAKPMSQMLVAESSDGSQRVVRLPGAAGAKTRMASSDVLSGKQGDMIAAIQGPFASHPACGKAPHPLSLQAHLIPKQTGNTYVTRWLAF